MQRTWRYFMSVYSPHRLRWYCPSWWKILRLNLCRCQGLTGDSEDSFLSVRSKRALLAPAANLSSHLYKKDCEENYRFHLCDFRCTYACRLLYTLDFRRWHLLLGACSVHDTVHCLLDLCFRRTFIREDATWIAPSQKLLFNDRGPFCEQVIATTQ